MLKKILSFKKLTICTFVLSLFNLLFYFSMRVIWTGIDKVVGGNSSNPPLWFHDLLLFIILVVFILTFTFAILRKEKLPMYILLGFSVLLTIGIGVIVKKGAIEYITFILRDFLIACLITSGIFVLVWIVFFYPKSKIFENKLILITFTGVISLFIILVSLSVGINNVTYKPVVYAVEDKYQIVFTTTMKSSAWVEVGDEIYYDLTAGSNRNQTKIHKVEVPMAALDSAKEYKVCYQAMLFRGPFGGYKGSLKSISSKFRPVDTSDGFNYYSISDVHGAVSSAIKTSSYFKDDLDTLFIIGDIVSLADAKSDCNKVNKYAYGVTKGEIPVVYARGNHEIKGNRAEDLYQYVGSKDQKFYYSVTLSDVFIIVLDCGEDHADDWWEYYGTSHYDLYRAEQTKFLNSLIANKETTYDKDNIKFKIALCHFPFTIKKKVAFLGSLKEQWTDLLSTIGINVLLSGHVHELYQMIPNDSDNYYNETFYAFVVSKRDDEQNFNGKENQLDNRTIGLASNVDFITKKMIVSYTNRYQEKISIKDIFTGKDYGKEIVCDIGA